MIEREYIWMVLDLDWNPFIWYHKLDFGYPNLINEIRACNLCELSWWWSDPLTSEVQEAIHHRVGDDTAHGEEVEHSKDDQQCLVTGGWVGLEYKLRWTKQDRKWPVLFDKFLHKCILSIREAFYFTCTSMRLKHRVKI